MAQIWVPESREPIEVGHFTIKDNGVLTYTDTEGYLFHRAPHNWNKVDVGKSPA